ncbi:hypothetical protein LPY66_16960 [Dehalobacter sp. DCM]|uniref:hypothetical protein n=1 Tax=Dehalobacter sp. DCM TaxID=2907827 RepID=UPI003081FCA0|nr:hypothetical protein LPY66_16960 [Dehalobacter sp. DCM]
MMRKNKKIFFAAICLLVLLFVATSQYNKAAQATPSGVSVFASGWEKNAAKFEEAVGEQENGATLPLTKLTPFEWDTVYTIKPGTTAQRIYNIIGYRWGEINDDANQGSAPLIFVHNGKVVCFVYGITKSYQFNFDGYKGDYLQYTPDTIRNFVTEKIDKMNFTMQISDYQRLLQQYFTCNSESELTEAEAAACGLTKQEDNIYTRVVSDRKDFAALNSRLRIQYGSDASYGDRSGKEIAEYLDQVDLVYCIKNTGGDYGIYDYNKYNGGTPYWQLDAKWYEPENLRKVTITTTELPGQNGSMVIKGYVFPIPKTANKVNVMVHNYKLDTNFIDNPVQVNKEKALVIAKERLKQEGVINEPSSAYLEIENQYYLERWDEGNTDYAHKYESVTEEKFLRVWHVYVHNNPDIGCRVNIWINATTGSVLCYHESGE